MRGQLRLDHTNCISPVKATLGEGPVWHPDEDALYFVDIKNSTLFRFDAKSSHTTAQTLDAPIGCLAPTQGRLLIAGFKDGVFALDPFSGARQKFVDPEPELSTNRLNDGKCGPDGAFWFGSMDDDETAKTGALWRLACSGELTKVDAGYCITNGPAFSPSGTTLYHTDTMQRTIYAFDVLDTGELSNKRVFTRFRAQDGYPDGMCIDADGGLWSGHWGGGRVTRFLPTGERDFEIHLPVSNVTSCAFGGEDYKTLFITTARKGRTEAQLQTEPFAGGLFATKTSFAGLPTARFEANLEEFTVK